MKKMLLTISIGLLYMSALTAQTNQQVNNLSTLFKTWGLIKYYHPTIASGQYDWDSVLITSIKEIMTQDNNAVHRQVNRMLAIAGPDTAALSKPAPDNPICYRNYDLSWIQQNTRLDRSQQKALQFIAEHPYSGLNYYAQPDRGNDSTVITPNEKPYAHMKYPDTHYRLLALARFWNIINYFYPYKYKVGKPWGEVLTELIPLMIQANDTLSWNKALARMAASINDSHGGLWPQVYYSIAGRYSQPFNFRLVTGKAVITAIADSAACQQAGITAGSVIETMDGITIAQKIKDYQAYVGGSSEGARLRDMHAIILNSHSRQCVLAGYQPNGKRFTATVNLLERNFIKEYSDFMGIKSAITSYLTADSIGYIYFANINQRNMDSIMRSVMHTKAIIFDMRNYPGYGIYFVPNYLLSQPAIYACNTTPDYRWPGMMKYMASNQGTSVARVGKNNPHPYPGRVILLVDERTQSAGEWACMTLQTAPRVTVIGSPTAGADGNVTRAVLPGGYNFHFSGLGIYYPDGRETQRTGIPVDIPVHYTIEDYMYKKDPVLQKALAFIRTSN